MQNNSPIFSPPIRWTLAVLSWLAFGVAGYLAITKINGSSVAGCTVGSHNGCDAVLNSAWSMWLGVPVAVLGLACYATLAALSVVFLFRPTANRWITTGILLLATLAAGASLWFIALQVFVIEDFCMFCLATDISGIAIGALAAWSAYRWWSSKPQLRTSGNSSANLSALRSAIPSGSRLAPIAATRTASPAVAESAEVTQAVPRSRPAASARSVALVGSVASHSALRAFAPPPSMPIAYGGALALLLLLIGGQIVFPAKTFKVQQVALTDQVDLSNSTASDSGTEPSNDAETRVAMRIPTEGDTESTDAKSDANVTAPEQGNGNGSAADAEKSDGGKTATPEPPPEPKRERKIKLLGGKLTLDVADQPIIGSVDAPHVVVEMVSYDCPHCRKTNKLMKKALSRYGDQVALVVLVLPLETKCNRLIVDAAGSHVGACTTARTALALAKLKSTTFPKFHEFLMGGDEKRPPSMTSILSKAFSMTDREKLQALRDSKEIEKQVAGTVDLFATLRQQNANNKDFGLPIQILGDHVMSGSIEKADDLYKAWEEHLGVKPR